MSFFPLNAKWLNTFIFLKNWILVLEMTTVVPKLLFLKPAKNVRVFFPNFSKIQLLSELNAVRIYVWLLFSED